MIFQDPMTSLNPLRTIGYHLLEVIRRFHTKLSKQEQFEKAVEELEKVGISQPTLRMKQYPHELSGGMRQRVLIAMAFLTNADLLIADEPTTALDVTIQAQILALIKERQLKEGLTVLFVTHDFGVVASICEEVKVMYRGDALLKKERLRIFFIKRDILILKDCCEPFQVLSGYLYILWQKIGSLLRIVRTLQ